MLHYQLGEGPTAAADVDPSQAKSWGQPIEEYRPDELTPATYPA